MRIVHIADIALQPESGMGRVGYEWKKVFEASGHEFIHIGKKEIGRTYHPALFPFKARNYFRKIYNGKADIILAHEPVSGLFINEKCPLVLFSHGLEQRGWELQNSIYKAYLDPVSIKSKMLFPLWRLKNCNKGLRYADRLLLSNSEDRSFAMNRFNRSEQDAIIFRNGIFEGYSRKNEDHGELCTIAFNGTWLKRKGVDLLVKAAKLLEEREVPVKWFLFGVTFPKEEIIKSFPPALHDRIEILPTYPLEQESELYARADIFVLPSFLEGQSLALLQAMASQVCCITSSCCAQIDIIKHLNNGLLFPPGDEIALADQIQLAVNNPELRNRLGKDAYRSMQGRDWNSVSKEIVRLVTEA